MTARNFMMSAAGYVEPPPAPDYQYNQVSMLLHADGTNGAQNNTFTDSAGKVTITRGGNATQGTFGPYGSCWSNYFNGTTDYLQTPTNAALNFNSVDYTVECWVYATTTTAFDSGGRGIVTDYLSNSYSRWLVSIDTNGKLGFYEQDLSGTNSIAVVDTANMPTYQWVHIAACKSGTTMYLFKNGSLVGTTTSAVRTNFGGRVNVGQLTVDTNYRSYFAGYISNVRVVKGTALYTSNFTPSTSPLTTVSGTSLLTCCTNRLLDKSSNNFAITKFGDVIVSKESPFAVAYDPDVEGTSMFLDGTGYLQIANDSSFNNISFDFTLDCWIYKTSTNDGPIITLGQSVNYGPYAALRVQANSSTNLQILTSQNGSNYNVNSTLTNVLTLNAWNYITVMGKSAGDGTNYNITLFVNGVSVGQYNSAYYNGAPLYNGTQTQIGSFYYFSNPTFYAFRGYIADLRYTYGAALYTGNFTPPTAPTSTGYSFHLKFKDYNVLDSTGKNCLSTVGNAQLSTTEKKYGTGSLYFDGTGDYLLTQDTSNQFDFGSGDFTVEAWINPTAFVADAGSIVAGLGATNGDWMFALRNSTQLGWGRNIIAWDLNTSGFTFSTNTWYHVAACRANGVLRLFVNGTEYASLTTSQTYNIANSYLAVGARQLTSGSYSAGQWFSGYIDDLRITKGYGRYSTTFTPPTKAFQNT